jgi:predicted ATPase
VIVSGEPGIGKSRLAAELLDDVAGSAHTRFRYYCNAQQKGNVLAPSIQTLEQQAFFAPKDSMAERLNKLRTALPDATPHEFRLIADLLMLPSLTESALKISPQVRRTQTIDALLGPLRAISRRHPVLVLFEDAHWSDLATIELLSTATRDIDQYRIMIVITARPEFRPTWEVHANVETIILDPMSIAESRHLIDWVAAERPLSRSVVQDIIKRSDGVPLFIEEVTRAAIDIAETADGTSAAHSPLPLTIHGSLLARLDRLGAARDVAKIAAVIGRDFSIELLASVSGRAERELRLLVSQLLTSGLVLSSTLDHRRFRFKHALIQDAAYGSIVRSERVGLHARIANALEVDFPDLANAEPQLLAHHFTEAGLLEKAVSWWLRAGVQSLMRSAALEALEPLEHGLQINANLPDGAARMQRELELNIAYAKALIATQGHASSSTGAVFARAHVLCRALGDPPHFLTILHGEWTHMLFRADLPAADRQAREILRLSEDLDDPSWSLIGCYCVGITALPLGNFREVVTYLERGLREAVLCQSAYAGPVVPNPEVVMRTYLSWALMNLGRFGAARRVARQAVADARKLDQVFTLAYATWQAAFTTLLTVSVREGLTALQRLQALAAQHGIVFFEAVAQIFCGWAVGMEGDPEQGLTLMRQGRAAYRATGNLLYVPSYMRLEAEILGRAGRFDEGLAMLADAEPLCHAASAMFDDSEFERTRGELLWCSGDEAAAEAALERAIGLAEARSATSFALRAALPFARMLAGQQRIGEAAKVLAPICAQLRGSGAASEITEARALLLRFRRAGGAA